MPIRYYKGRVTGIGRPVTYKGPVSRPFGNAAQTRLMRAADPNRMNQQTKMLGLFGPMLPIVR